MVSIRDHLSFGSMCSLGFNVFASLVLSKEFTLKDYHCCKDTVFFSATSFVCDRVICTVISVSSIHFLPESFPHCGTYTDILYFD